MAKMRYAIFVARLTVPATDTLSAELNGLLRDILPDERFRIHGFLVNVENALGLGDLAMIMLAKNRVASAAEVPDIVNTTHAIVASFAHRNSQAAGTFSSAMESIIFPEPLDFDTDDSLNLSMWGTNSDAGPQVCSMRLVMYYEAR